MHPLPMTLLLVVMLGAFAVTAFRRIQLLRVGMPAPRIERLLERMATAPDGRESFVGWLQIYLIFALPAIGAGLAVAALTTKRNDVTDFVLFNAVGAIATAGGLLLVWAMRAQIKMPKYQTAGLAHYLIFVGFAVLLLRTIILVGRSYQPGFNLFLLDPRGPLPWGLLGKSYNLMKDLVVLGVLLGVAVFIKFRLLDKVQRLAYGWHAWVVLGVIASMMLADSFYDAGAIARAAVAAGASGAHSRIDQIAMEEGAPVGAALAHMFVALGLTNTSVLHGISLVGYWTHVTLVWSFLNYLPYGKHFHVITALPNVLTRDLSPPGRLPALAKTSDELMEKLGAAFELPNPSDAPVGVAQIQHLSWKSLLDLYTCTECGRCSDHCPAHRTGKLLSPKQLTLDLRDHLYSRSEEIVKHVGERAETPATSNAALKHVDLVPGVIDPDVLWACTTCRACEEQCPVMITYVDKIVQMRRNLVMVKGEFPHELQKTFTALETNGNPWNLTRMDRGAWADGLGVATMSEKPDAAVLYWVGCAASYDDNAKKIARAVARILKAAGVDFAILGSEETCTGDPARRSGNEHLYMMLAEQNIATLNGYQPRKIVTTCPHCFNTLLNEYPDLGGKYDVVHHSDFLLGLLIEGRIRPTRPVRGKVVFHDSCYLGRYNNVYESPRQVLESIPGLELVEAEWSREKGLCCGAGGGQMWMEEQNSDRVNKRRTLQLLDTGATTIASGCPFCHTMLTDGLKALDGTSDDPKRAVTQVDIAVLLERSLALDGATASTAGGSTAAAAVAET